MMQTDVKSAHLSAAGSYYAGRTRLRGIVVTPKATTAIIAPGAICHPVRSTSTCATHGATPPKRCHAWHCRI